MRGLDMMNGLRRDPEDLGHSPVITTIDGHQFTVSDPEFDTLRIGQAAFFNGRLQVIIGIDRERRIVSASDFMTTVISHLRN